MYAYSMTQWLFFFYFYCFFGWCFESAYVSLKSKRLVNRGFMRGPFLPLYGSGAIMMLLASRPFQTLPSPQNLLLIYVAGCIGATVLEYITGVAMETLFKVRYWDYSKNPLNFQGHICLGSSLAWGLLTILMTEVAHKPVEGFVLGIPGPVLTGVTFVMTALIGADFALSFKAAMDLRDVLIRLEKARGEMARLQRRVDVIIALTGEELEKRRGELAELREKYNIHLADRERLARLRDVFQRDMIRSNPTMVSRHFGESLRELQEKLEEQVRERRAQRKER